MSTASASFAANPSASASKGLTDALFNIHEMSSREGLDQLQTAAEERGLELFFEERFSLVKELVGAVRIELTTSWTRTTRATRLRYAPRPRGMKVAYAGSDCNQIFCLFNLNSDIGTGNLPQSFGQLRLAIGCGVSI